MEGGPNSTKMFNIFHGDQVIKEIKENTERGPDISGRSQKTVRTPPESGGTAETVTAPLTNDSKQGGLRRKLKALDRTIRELHDFVGPKNNVHSEIKKKIARAMTEIALVMKEAETDGGKMAATQAQQAPKAIEVIETPKRPTNVASKGATDKRKRSVEAAKERTPKTRRRDTAAPTPKISRGDARRQNGHRGSKAMTKRPRADAIVVEKVGEATTYADILRMVKGDPNLKELGERVTRVKRNQKGQMMFELARDEGAKRDELQDAVSKALGGKATVTVRTQEANIVCKDLDEVTTKDDVRKALMKELHMDGLPESAIRSMRTSYGGTQTAVISLPFEYARRAVQAGKVKIGWTICRVREATKPTSCFRCFDYGHMARDCKNVDRSKLCRRCGEGGHIAKNCNKDPCCMICSNGNKKAPHITGSSRCPKFRSSTKTEKT